MNNLQNLHTHSTYCDGSDTLEEMIKTAIEKGFSSIGFSGHSPVNFDSIYAMSLEGEMEYKKEITNLKKKYDGVLDIFCGIELDTNHVSNLDGYDYVLGSHHYFSRDGRLIGFDRSADEVKSVIDCHFGGDGIAFAKAYYNELGEHLWKTNVDILAHFDIITKNCEKTFLFDTECEEYKKLGFEAISSLRGKIPFFEVNTGAISRGYRTSPYPCLDFIKEFKKQGYGAVITSDCHDRNYLDESFALARELLFEAGFREKYILTKNGFVAVEL